VNCQVGNSTKALKLKLENNSDTIIATAIHESLYFEEKQYYISVIILNSPVSIFTIQSI
jgi:hypothetical protein